MVGIALISHGGLCEGMEDSVKMIAGAMEQAKTVSLRPGMSPDSYREKVKEAILELDTGDGVLVMADIPGGTPYNSAALLMREFPKIAVVTGLNLPMAVSVVLERDEDTTLEDLVETAVVAGSDGIKTLRGKKKDEGRETAAYAAQSDDEEEDL